MFGKLLRMAGRVLALSLIVGSAFAEDAYIENTNGNQYFNSGHFIGPHTRIEADIQLLELTNQFRPFGVAGSDSETRPYCEVYLGEKVSGGPLYWSYVASKADYSAQAANAYQADYDRHTIVLDLPSKKFEVRTDGTVDHTSNLAAVSSGTQTVPLGIFAKCQHQSGMYSSVQNTFVRPTKMRLYSFRIYESGTLVKEFIPWVKGGVAGLKETKSGRFHTGENARSCVAGGDVTIEKDDPYVALPDNDVMARYPVMGKTLYFQTSYTFKPSSRLELDYALLTPDWTASTKWAYETHAFYAEGSSGSMLYLMPYGSNANGCYYYKVGTKNDYISYAGIDYAYNVRRKVSASASKIQMETAGYTNFNITSSAPITANLTSTLLQLGLRSGSFPACPLKVYGLKIYETANGVETLVRNYQPCITNSVPILRDTLAAPTYGLLPTVYGSRNTTTYGSPDNNTHTNIMCEAGGDIGGDEEAKEAYLDFDGVDGHLINTEYVVTKDSRVETDFAVWNNNFRMASATAAPVFFHQKSSTDGIWFSLYYPSGAFRYGWRFSDYNTGKNEWVKKTFITNERVKFVFDAPNNTLTSYRGGVALETFTLAQGAGTLTATTCSTTLRIGGSCDGRYAAGMRLYSVKIYKSGVLDRCFVPCLTNGVAGLYETCQNRFFPLTGGKVRGKGYKGQSGEFVISPQPARLTRTGTGSTATLTCLAVGAQSYEWYENGVLMPGETSDSLTLAWTKAEPHVRTYSVVPVYTVFNETVKGDPATAEVEYLPTGMTIVIR